ncbi:MAG TPA: glycosyltransferase family 2 protein [Ignavibacteriales bacterium]|nr:glycosyltransferase family 2 protein [Ignavibacteriales bacterium]
MMIKISIVIPCRNEVKYIFDFLNSVIENDYPKEYMEIFIIDGESTDGTLKIIEEFKRRNSTIKILFNKKKTVPYALNMGIKAASGDYIIRLDVHTRIPQNYFSELINSAQNLNADNVGTICLTDIKNKNSRSIAIKKVLSNQFGVGNSYFRIGSDRIREVDTVPFGCFKKEVFEKVGLFNENLERNQDIELNKRIKRVGGAIFLIPNIYSIYFAREEYLPFAKNNFATGMWNILTIYLSKRMDSISLRHFIPLIFILSIVIPLFLSIYNLTFILISFFVIIVYVLFIFFISLKLNEKGTSILSIIMTFVILHFSYGFGSLVGIFKINFLFKQ